jgi:hypothetical protein
MKEGRILRIITLGLFVLLVLAAGMARADSIETLTQNVFTTAESLDPGLTGASIPRSALAWALSQRLASCSAPRPLMPDRTTK